MSKCRFLSPIDSPYGATLSMGFAASSRLCGNRFALGPDQTLSSGSATCMCAGRSRLVLDSGEARVEGGRSQVIFLSWSNGQTETVALWLFYQTAAAEAAIPVLRWSGV